MAHAGLVVPLVLTCPFGTSQGQKTRVAHTSRRTLAGCMRLLDSGADMPNYGASAPPVTVFHGVSWAEGPWGQTPGIRGLRHPSTRELPEQSQNVYENKGRGQKVIVGAGIVFECLRRLGVSQHRLNHGNQLVDVDGL